MEIRKYTKPFFLIFVLMAVFSACKKDGGDTDIADRPIVAGYLIAGEAITLNVYQQKGLLDTTSYGQGISGLKIIISNGTRQVTLTEGSAGTYTSTDATLVVEGTTCTMSFEYNGKTISAESKVPTKPVNFTASSLEQAVPNPDPYATVTTFYPVTLNWTNQSSDYFLLVFKNQEISPNRIGSGFGMRRGYENIEEYLGQVSTYQIQKMTFMFAGYYDTYLYHINPEYNEILNSSGTSSLNLTNPASNVKNGLGIFTAMSVSKLVLHVYEE